MRKPLLLIAASVITLASCQKPSSNNGPWTCTCNYAFLRGFYFVADTMVNTGYASGTSRTDAQLYCTNQSNLLKTDSLKQKISCYIH